MVDNNEKLSIMKILDYQQRAVSDVVRHMTDMLTLDGLRHTLVFKAPTGSGKTVMTTMALEQIVKATRGKEGEPALIWIAPNSLHEQSYFKMKNYFGETRELRPVMYDEVDHSEGVLRAGEVLFANWESINKDKNRMVRDTEQGVSLFEICRRTREAGHPIIVVIDEEHEFWSSTADKSRQVLDKIEPKVELRVSATPKTHGEQQVNIARELVVREEMIKERIVLNPDVRQGQSDERTLTQHLLELSLRRRHAIAEAYRRQGSAINPLLLIQLPNDNSTTLTTDENSLIETIENYMEQTAWNMTKANGRLAVWLSVKKENLEGIEEATSAVDVLLFKQAIAKGWDCPRAAVLLIFRKNNSFEFTMQTVGRILRMPEQRFYDDALLNRGYVYTDISRDIIKIVQDDIGYLSRLVAKRRDDVEVVRLDGKGAQRLAESRNRLGSDFKDVLRRVLMDRWQLRQTRLRFDDEDSPDGDGATSPYAINRQNAEKTGGITFAVQQVQVEIAEDVELKTELDDITELNGHKYGYARHGQELRLMYNDFCSRHLGPFEKSSSTVTLGRCLTELMEELFECEENHAMKVILSSKQDNNRKFADIVRRSIEAYARKSEEKKRAAAERSIVDVEWRLPDERLYDEETNETATAAEHALQPFVRQKKASKPERRFEQFLEEHKDDIAWWYKNGDKGREHYAIDYEKSDGSRGLFYVDFIIKLKSERLMLMDTKSAGSDPEAPAKHNALIDYCRAHEAIGGGIVIEDDGGGNWLYSDTYIENTTDHSGWRAFWPGEG